MYCENCKINFDTDTGSCPLCFENFGKARYEGRLFPPRPKTITKKAMAMFSQVYFFTTIIVTIILGIINYLANSRLTWSMLIFSCLVFLYVLVRNTILAKSEIAIKTLLQSFLMGAFLVAIDYYATGFKLWSLTYAMPFLLIASTLLLTILGLSNKRKWRDFMLTILFMAFLGFLPFILYLTNVVKVLLPSLIALLYSFFTLVGLIVFYRKKLTNEFKKSFHI